MKNNNKSSVSGLYIAGVGIISFVLAALFYVFSQLLAEHLNNIMVSLVFLLLIILTGIIFDTIGTSAAAATETVFHAKASKKVPGAKESVYLVRNADKVANIANDVIGDIAGTVSGAVGISIVFQIIYYYPGVNKFTIMMLTTALIAAFTVRGKAFGKKMAISRGNDIIFIVGKIMAKFKFIKGNNLPASRHK